MHPAHRVLAPWIDHIVDPWRLPTIDQLNAWRCAAGPGFATLAKPAAYELHIAEHGVVPTRPEDWHDAFNALCWLAWPRTKRAINRGHCQILRAGGEAERRRRSPARDVLTLLDEGGAIMLCSRPEPMELLLARRWQELFVDARELLTQHARLLLLGHASLDELRQPRLGITAKCLVFEVGPDVIALDDRRLRAHADLLAAARLDDPALLGRGRDYPPLPLLGWPGWHPDNADLRWYADHPGYFRSPSASTLP
jgi:hypothetical protein